MAQDARKWAKAKTGEAMNDAKCRLCRDGLDTEEPNAIYAINPETLRLAWMHRDCAHSAYTELSDEDREKFLQHEGRETT